MLLIDWTFWYRLAEGLWVVSKHPIVVIVVGFAFTNIRSHREHARTEKLTARSVSESVASREALAAQVAQVHEEVRTGNALRLGEMASDAETRRIEKISPGKRTEEEQGHIEQIPPKH